MFNRFKSVPPAEQVDPLADRISRVRWNAEQLLEAHVRCNGLHKISKEAVRNAMLYAHSLEESVSAYEREMREREAREALAKTQVRKTEEVPACE